MKFKLLSARRRFDVDTTLFGRQQRCINVKTTYRVLAGLFIDRILQFSRKHWNPDFFL